jgi:hypothetical protein
MFSVSCGIGGKATETPLPTNTAIPTNTPLPTPTKTLPPPPPTDTPLPPTPTSTPATGSTGLILDSYPPNCLAGTLPGYMSCMDGYGSLRLDVPDYWSETVFAPWEHEGSIIGRAIKVAPSLEAFNTSFTAEGVFLGATDLIALLGGYVQTLDYFTDIYAKDCDLIGRYDYSGGIYRGKYDLYRNCEGEGGYDAYVLSAVNSEDQFSMIILIYMQVMPGDTITVEQILNNFTVVGPLR